MSRSRFTLAFDHHNMVPAPAGVATPHVIFKTEDGILSCYGTTVPTDDVAGYAKGCEFYHTDGGVNDKLYVNEGDADNCDFISASGEGLIQIASVDITADEIRALYSDPKEIIAAPGENKFIEFISVVLFHDQNGATFDVTSEMEFRYGGSASTNNGIEVAGAFISNTYIIRDSADMVMQFHSEYDAQSTPESSLFNKNINLFANQADPTGAGTGVLKVRMAYRILDFN